jgi:DNA-binding transcriptional regulator YiaG
MGEYIVTPGYVRRTNVMNADQFKTLRKQVLGLSQRKLARMLGVRHNSVWRWEHGIRTPAERYMQRLLSMMHLARQVGTPCEHCQGTGVQPRQRR